MSVATVISEVDLAQRTQYVLDEARRSHLMILERHGEEQLAILSALDYRILVAVVAYHTMPVRSAPVCEPVMAPRGLDVAEMQRAIAADADSQGGWNRVLAAYFDADISLGRAAELLCLSSFELADRFQRLGLPLLICPANLDEARAEFSAFGN